MQRSTPRFWQSSSCSLFLFVVAIFFVACAPIEEGLDVDNVEVQRSALDDEVHDWTHGDWTSRVAWEARYALCTDADGDSDHGSNTSNIIYGDWDYANNDTTARDNAKDEGDDVQGDLGYYNGYYRGGWCTYFVRLVLYRSVYWNFDDHYTMPGHYDQSVYTFISGEMTDDPDDWDEGWVIRSSTAPHFAIADERDYHNGSWGWWVIDSNWVGPAGGHVIGKHFMTDSALSSGDYYGWQPSLGTDNE